MKTKHIKAKDLQTSLWAGGTTTQLYIYPENSQYKNLDFDFRISTAKVELPSSDFTALPGISRQLMILEGGIIIEHQNHHKKTLNKFDIDTFEGDWQTSSKGTCIDFNLMCSKGNSGKISAHSLIEDTQLSLNLNANSKFYCLYIFKGKIEYSKQAIEAGDMFIISDFETEKIDLKVLEATEMVLTEIAISN
jgi:environmental stress-induced protein Ves